MNIKQHWFVTEYLRFGDKAIAYKNAYDRETSCYKTLTSAANRLLRNPEVAKALHEAEARIRYEVEREVTKKRVYDVFSIEEKRDLLKKIATGDIYFEHTIIRKNCTVCTVLVKPLMRDRLYAIRDDSRIAGHYYLPAAASARAGRTSVTTTRDYQDITMRRKIHIPANGAEPAQPTNDPNYPFPIAIVSMKHRIAAQDTPNVQNESRENSPLGRGMLKPMCASGMGTHASDISSENDNKRQQKTTTKRNVLVVTTEKTQKGTTTRLSAPASHVSDTDTTLAANKAKHAWSRKTQKSPARAQILAPVRVELSKKHQDDNNP